MADDPRPTSVAAQGVARPSPIERPLLTVAALRIADAGTRLADGLSFTVEAGTTLEIRGPNGAGKSSLLRALIGEVDYAGSVRFAWQRGMPSGANEAIGYVPQRLSLDKTLALTVTDFLALTRQRRPVAAGVAAATRRVIAAMLEEHGLAPLSERPLAGLSGGELRRLLLAHATTPWPELLLLDEPNEGVDRAGLEKLEQVLVAAKAAGVTTLLVTHDSALAARHADATLDLGSESAST